MNFFDLTAFELPISNPVLKFSIILFIILFAPIFLNKIKIPHLIGLIIAGALIGPNGLNLLERDSSIELFGTVGLLYIMFLAGLEIDMEEFKKNSSKSLIFGMYTFLIPMITGFSVFYYWLEFDIMPSVLIASMFASHTLVTYPILGRYGVVKNRAVNITLGGTMITDTLALLVLAVIVGMSKGSLPSDFWQRMAISLLIFVLIVSIGFPILGRWFFKKSKDNISQYIFVLALVFLSAFFAQAAGIEAIIGAFLAGLALNKLIPSTSALMNRIDFVGNALFIPFFLIGVGMLINFNAFVKDTNTILVAISMTVIATVAKFLAAWLAQKSFRYTRDERRLIFGLSNSQAAATLAAVLVGYKIILNQPEIDAAALQGIVIEPVRLITESVLNGTILMILVTCTLASFSTQIGARNVSLYDSQSDESEKNLPFQKILIPLNSLKNIDEVIGLSVAMKSKKNKHGLFALNIVENNTARFDSEKSGNKILESAAKIAASTDNGIELLLRYDQDMVNGINNVTREYKITDIILTLDEVKGISLNFFDKLTHGILEKSDTTTLLYKPTQPFSTIKRHLIVVPDKAEREFGFPFWLVKLWYIYRNTNTRLVFYSSEMTTALLKKFHTQHNISADYINFSDWDDFLIIAKEIKIDDNLVVIMSRQEQYSYHPNMEKIPVYLNKYFKENTFLVVYPLKIENDTENKGAMDNPSFHESVQLNIDRFDDIAKTIGRIFRKQ